MASAAIKALKEVRTAFEEGLLDEEHYSVFRNLFVESRTRILERDGRGERSSLEAVGSDTLMAAAEGFLDRVGGDRKVDEVSPSASPGPEEPELTMVEENTKASLEGPSVPRTPELVGPISRAPISPAPRPRRVRSSPVFFDPVPPKRVKRAREEPKERAKSKAKSKSPPRCRDNGCSKVRGHQFTLSFIHLPFDLSVSPAEADTRSHHTSAATCVKVACFAAKQSLMLTSTESARITPSCLAGFSGSSRMQVRGACTNVRSAAGSPSRQTSLRSPPKNRAARSASCAATGPSSSPRWARKGAVATAWWSLTFNPSTPKASLLL